MIRIRHRVCHKLHPHASGRACIPRVKCFHRRPLSSLKHVFFSLFTWKRVCILQNSSMALKYKSKYGTSRTRDISLRESSSEQTSGSTSSNNKMAVDSLIMRFSVHVNLLFFLFRNPFLFENTTVNTEERRKGHCEGKLNPLSLLIREHSRIHAVDHVKLVYHIREQIESLTSNKHSSYYFRMGFTNLPRIDCTRLINRIICENNTRNVIPRRDQRYQTDFFK